MGIRNFNGTQYFLQDYALKRSKKEAKIALCILFMSISTLWGGLFWITYLKKPNDIVSAIMYGVSNSLSIGDSFLIQKELSSLKASESFDFIELDSVVTKPAIIVYKLTDNSFTKNTLIRFNEKYYINKNFIFCYNYDVIDSRGYFIGKMTLGKKISFVSIIISYFGAILLSFLIYLYVKKTIYDTYKKITAPILEMGTKIENSDLIFSNISSFVEINTLFRKLCDYDANMQQAIKTIKTREKELEEMTKFKAMVDTIRMIAHDVRKPYSLMSVLFQMLGKQKNPDKQIKLIECAKTDLIPALTYAENLLKDIMNLGADVKLNVKSISPVLFFQKVLQQVFSLKRNINIHISWDLNHSYEMNVDDGKVFRVFYNIIENAVQAMNGTGEIRFATKELKYDKVSFIQFSITNTNSYIPLEDRLVIFNQFITKGKKNGTGLGLAIVKQFVERHGGKVSCSAWEEKNEVEFSFTLPNSENKDEVINNFTLHNSSQEYMKLNESTYHFQDESQFLEKEIQDFIQEHSKNIEKLSIVHLDDDISYTYLISSYIEEFFPGQNIQIKNFTSPSEAIDHCRQHKPHIFICDIDLKNIKMNGFDVVKIIRNYDKKCLIYLNSNRMDIDIFKLSAECGATGYLPKPLAAIHFLKMVQSYIILKVNHSGEKHQNTSNISNNINNYCIEIDNNFNQIQSKKPNVIIIDDEDIFLEGWTMGLHDAECLRFKHPELAYEYMLKNLDFVKTIDMIIVDYYYQGCAKNVVEMKFVEACREINYTKPIFLSSSLGRLDADEKVLFDGLLEKGSPLSFKEIILQKTFSSPQI